MSGSKQQVLYRYDADEHPEIHKWVKAQTNRTQSITHALLMAISKTGAEQDLVQTILQQSLEDDNVVTEGMQQKDMD